VSQSLPIFSRPVAIRYCYSANIGKSAGSRDSSLTNHGILQAKRLGAHIATRQVTIGPVKHIFASTLQRAYLTAEAIAEACSSTATPHVAGASSGESVVTLDAVIRLDELCEKDFGSLEGKKFGFREDVADAETHESIRLRVHRFLDVHFQPIVQQLVAENHVVIIVAHGIVLNILLKALVFRYPPKSSSLGDRRDTELMTAWRNTGVMQTRFEVSTFAASSRLPSSKTFHMTVEQANNVDHLQGLKKTRGGIGSAQFDSRQRTVDSFFVPTSKERKSGDALD